MGISATFEIRQNGRPIEYRNTLALRKANEETNAENPIAIEIRTKRSVFFEGSPDRRK